MHIVGGVEVGLRDRLNGLLEVRAGSRFSDLERFRKAPAKITGLELERALSRVGDVRRLGAGAVDLSALPGNRVLALARYGLGAKAPLLRELAEPRRRATLVATIRHLEQKAIDDTLDLFAVLMQTKLLARAARESAKEQLRRFAAASAKLTAAIQILLEASGRRRRSRSPRSGRRSSAWCREGRWRPRWPRPWSWPLRPTRRRTRRGAPSC